MTGTSGEGPGNNPSAPNADLTTYTRSPQQIDSAILDWEWGINNLLNVLPHQQSHQWGGGLSSTGRQVPGSTLVFGPWDICREGELAKRSPGKAGKYTLFSPL